jgi:signal transduction histidine kinase
VIDPTAPDVSSTLLQLVARLATPDTREAAAYALANALGADAFLLFARDPEVDVLVSAPGFPQTLPDPELWRSFLTETVRRGRYEGLVPLSSDGELLPAIGHAHGSDIAFVLVGTAAPAIGAEWLCELLPLLAAVLRAERHKEDLGVAVAELDEARALAEAASRVRSEFLATMSHELRTPLNAIAGYVQMLEFEVHGPVTEGQRTVLARIDRSQRHLLGIINDILNLSRIEAGRVDYVMTDVPLSDALADVQPVVAPQLAAKSLSYEVRRAERMPVVRADREKLQQILVNLLSNATKFTDRGGRVWVDVGERRDAPGKVFLRVSDTGRGIPPHKLERIFEPFTQVDASHSRSGEGVGLGLTISRDLARGMGGDLRARSEIGKGSVFTLTLEEAAGSRSP